MSTHVETTAAMSSPAEPPDCVDAEPDTEPAPAGAAGAEPGGAVSAAAGALQPVGRTERKPMSLDMVISVFGGLIAAVTTVLGALLVWQLSAMNQNINEMRTELRSEFRSEIGGLRTEIGGLGTELRSEFRSEIGGLGTEIGGLGTEIGGVRSEIGGLGTELRSEFRSEIGGLGTELRSEFRSEIGGLRSEMQAGFREVNATLLDHTERLARLETWAGLTAADE